MKKNSLQAIRLGLISYSDGLKLQEHFVKRQLENSDNKDHVVLLLEHLPVYTVGIRSREYSTEEEARLISLGADYYKTNRGGLITFHGPGQLVAYPILNLSNFGLTIKGYVCSIEKSIISLCNDLGISAKTSPHTGVWVGDNKICAIGLHRKHNITSHGLALNCDVDLKWFNHIVACGIVGKGVTSVSKELGKPFPVSDCVNLFLKRFAEQINAELVIPSDDEVKAVLGTILSNT